jgi:aspartate racemase
MRGDIYRFQLQRAGVVFQIPRDDECQRLDRFIFEEMVLGKFTREARQYVMNLVGELRSRGCDAVGLCCTELSLPALDSTQCRAMAAVKRLAQGACVTQDLWELAAHEARRAES